jgi:integrase
MITRQPHNQPDRPTVDPDAALTLRAAFDKHYERDRLSASTLQQFYITLRKWEALTDDPPVGSITNAILDRFKSDVLSVEANRPATFNSRWRNIRAILRRLASDTPNGVGVIGRTPYVRACRVPWRVPHRIDLDDLSRFYVAAQHAQHPRRLGYDPPLFWRALVVVAYFTALRKGDLFSIRIGDVDLSRQTITFTARKTDKAAEFPLHPVACEHIARILGPREFLFPTWLAKTGELGLRLREIQAAGKVSRGFTLHDIRRTAATEAERVRSGMGRVLLQHAPTNVTECFYLNQIDELAEAIRQMRIPLAFKHGLTLVDRAEQKAQRERLHVDRFAMPYVPTPDDWIFPEAAIGGAAGAVCFRGRWFAIGGRTRWQALRALALAEQPIGVAELAPIVCPHARHTEKRVQAEMSNLRRTIRDMLGLTDKWDPVRCVDRGERNGGHWQIWLPPHCANGNGSPARST